MRRRTWSVVFAMSLLGAGVLPEPASALSPAKAGWWNAASVGDISAPLPTTAAGDLHVGQGPSASTAIAAVDYELAGQVVSAAVLELKVTPGSAVGTVALVACPTADRGWKAAEDGPMTAAPAYDCNRLSVPGFVSANGDTVTFLLDDTQQRSGGYSLAIVPVAGAAPFQVDLVKPRQESLTLTVAGPPPVVVPSRAVGLPSGAGVSSTPVPVPLDPPTSSQPVIAAPRVAPPAAPAPGPVQARPVAAPQPVSNRERYVAGSLLALFAGVFTWLLQQRSPPLRLLGGVARTSRAAHDLIEEVGPVRGIGRFAAARTAPARRLL
jgi:hypothetical protein